MKLQLDTTNKTIKIEESVLLSELVEILEKLLPNELWKEFRLEANIVINRTNPVIPYVPLPEPWRYPWITYTTGDGSDLSLTPGNFNVEI